MLKHEDPAHHLVLQVSSILTGLHSTSNTYRYYVKLHGGKFERPCQTLDYYMERAHDTFNQDRATIIVYAWYSYNLIYSKNIHIRGLEEIEMTTYIGSSYHICIDVKLQT